MKYGKLIHTKKGAAHSVAPRFDFIGFGLCG